MSETTPATPFNDPLATWNRRFDRDDYLFGEEPNRYLVGQSSHLRPGKVLAIADGEGRNSVWLARQGFAVDAFDFSPVAVTKARALAQRHSVHVDFHCLGWQDFDWGHARYDNVVGVFFQFADPQARAELFARIDRALRPGGVVVIQGYGKEQLRFNTGGPGRLENLYDEALLHAAFSGWEVLDSRTYIDEIHEGSGHAGMSSLVGFTARKPG